MSLYSKIVSLIKSPTGNMWGQIFRYLVSGGIAFCVDASLLYALTEWLGIYYLVSSAISFSVGLLITYLMSIFWVFDYRSKEDKRVEFIIFLLIGIIGLCLTSLFMWIFTTKLSLYYLLSKIITTVIVFVWNFIAKKLLLFSRKNGKKK